MDSEYLIINVDGNWKIVEDISIELPDNCVSILSLTLHIKSVILSDSSSLMIPSNHCHAIWVLYFEKAKQCYYLYTMSSSIDIIS